MCFLCTVRCFCAVKIVFNLIRGNHIARGMLQRVFDHILLIDCSLVAKKGKFGHLEPIPSFVRFVYEDILDCPCPCYWRGCAVLSNLIYK